MDIHDDINVSAPTNSSLGANSDINVEEGENSTTVAATTVAGSRDCLVCHQLELHHHHQNNQPVAQEEHVLPAEIQVQRQHVPRATNASAAILASMPDELLWTIFEDYVEDDLRSCLRVPSSHYSYLEFRHAIRLSRPLRGTCARWSKAIRHKLFGHSGHRRAILYRVPLLRLVDLVRDFPDLKGVLVACGNPNDYRTLEYAKERLMYHRSPFPTGFIGAITWQDTEMCSTPFWDMLDLGRICEYKCAELKVPLSAMIGPDAVEGLSTIQYPLLPWALDFICGELLSFAKYHSSLILGLLDQLGTGAHVEVPAFVLCMLSTSRDYPPGRLVLALDRLWPQVALQPPSLASCTFRDDMEILCCPYGLHDKFHDRTMPREFRAVLTPHLPRDTYESAAGVGPTQFEQMGSQVNRKLADEMNHLWTVDVMGSSLFKEVDSFSCISGDIEFNYWNMDWFLHSSGISKMKNLRVVHTDVSAGTSFEEIFNTVMFVASNILTCLTIDAQPMIVREAHHCLYLADPDAFPNLTHLDIPMPNICVEAFARTPRRLRAKSGFWRLRTDSWRCCVDVRNPSGHAHSHLCRRSLFDTPEDFLVLMECAREMFLDDGWHVEIAVHFDQTGGSPFGPVFDEGIVLEPLRRTVRHCVGRCREDVFSKTWSMLTPTFGPAIPERVVEERVLVAPPAHHRSLRGWFLAYGLERFRIDPSRIPSDALVSTEQTDREVALQPERLASYPPHEYAGSVETEPSVISEPATEDDTMSDSE